MAGGPDIKLRLTDVDIGNYHAIMMLELADDQKEFVWTNSGPLAEAAYVPGFRPRAAYLGDEPIGLGLWGPYYPGYDFKNPPEPGACIIDHVMIDRRHQGKGHGRRLVELMISEIRNQPDSRRILLAADPDNTRAIDLYASMGFADIGRAHDGDVLMELKIPSD